MKSDLMNLYFLKMCAFRQWDDLKLTSATDCMLKDPHYLIQKVCSLLGDEVASKMLKRHVSLVHNFTKASPDGIFIEDLPNIMFALEFFTENYDKAPEYKTSLNELLSVCRFPPLMKKSSEGLFKLQEMKEYFTILGYMIAVLHVEELQNSVIQVIHGLLTRNEPAQISCIKLKLCHFAMEQSNLPVILAELLEVACPTLYPHLLTLVKLVVSVSKTCCKKLAGAGAVNYILQRLDPNYFTRDPLIPPSDSDLCTTNNTIKVNEMVSALEVLWELLLPLRNLMSADELNPPSQCALWNLRYVLRSETRCKNVTTRNDIVGLILLALDVFPNLAIVESGLAEDIAMLAIATEICMDKAWATDIKFSPSNEDLEFKKLLLTCVCYFSKYPATAGILQNQKVMTGVLHLVNPGLTLLDMQWTPSQFWELLSYALRTLTVIAPLLPEEFVENKGSIRLLLLIDWYRQEPYDVQLLCLSVKTLSSAVMTEHSLLLDDIRDQEGIHTILNLCGNILRHPYLTLEYQHILTYSFYILEILIKNKGHFQKLYGINSIDVTLQMLSRILEPRSNDTIIDNHLIICLADFMWEFIVSCPENLKVFIEKGGVYKILDVLEKCIFSVKIIFLAILVDMCEEGSCIPHILTWRYGECKSSFYLTEFVDIWKKEEIRSRVKRTDAGCLEDIERPLMGEEQWNHTFNKMKDPSTSPAIADIVGSTRPKIYAIIQLLKHRHEDKIKLANNHYRMNYLELSTEGKVTMSLIENYLAFKIGEVWVEVAEDLKNSGVQPLAFDGDALMALCQKYRTWSITIQSSQIELLKKSKQTESKKEIELYNLLRECRLASSIDALKELEYICRTTNRQFQLAVKENQRNQVNHSLNLPPDGETFHSHRTYLENTNVTVIPKQEFVVRDFLPLTLDEEQPLEPVSMASIGSTFL